MSFTNKTPNYELPQWLADDKPTFLSDMNGAFSDIDTAMKANENAAASAQSTADANTLSINGITTDLDGAGGVKARLSAVETAESNLEGSVNTINSLIGNGTPTTTDQTIIGAINEIHGFTGEGPLNTTAQTVTGAINELAAGGGGSTTLDGLTDVDITSPTDGQILKYDATNQKWINGSGGSATGGNMSFLGIKRFQASGDGTKTAAQLLNEIYTEFSAYVAAKSTGYYWRAVKATANSNSFVGYADATGLHDNTDDRLFQFSELNAALAKLTVLDIVSGSSAYNEVSFVNGSVTNRSTDVIPVGATALLDIEEYEIA